MSQISSQLNKPIIIYDGICNLCNSFVNFIIQYDKKEIFYFTSSRSETSKAILKKYSITQETTTIVLLLNDEFYIRSTAILKILELLGFPVTLIRMLEFIPRKFRDFIYDFTSSHRYQWFGKRDRCTIPRAEIKSRFLLM